MTWSYLNGNEKKRVWNVLVWGLKGFCVVEDPGTTADLGGVQTGSLA